MVATRGRTFKRPWRRSCLSSKLKSSSAPIGRKDSWCFHAVGSSNAPLLDSTAAKGLPRIGRTSIATRWRSCGLPQSASCCENFVIPPDVFGQTLRLDRFRRDDKYDRVRLRNQAAEARFPVLASSDVVAVEERRKAYEFEPGHQFVGERGRILPRIGDEDLEFLSCANVRHGYPTKPKSVAGRHKTS